jgi:hypothetical protein
LLQYKHWPEVADALHAGTELLIGHPDRLYGHADVNEVWRGVSDHVHESVVGAVQLDVRHCVGRREHLSRKREAHDAEGLHRSRPRKGERFTQFRQAS